MFKNFNQTADALLFQSFNKKTGLEWEYNLVLTTTHYLMHKKA